MSFKENLLKKIKIDQLARRVLASLKSTNDGLKLDKESMRSLLEMGPYRYQRERDLDLYIEDLDGEQSNILVLDNELPIYHTTVEDVAIRKSPYIGEMVKIRNIVKILKDSDVKTSRKDESVKIVQDKCLELLDLSYNDTDIQQLAEEGKSSLENGYAEGIKESLVLFSNLLSYKPAPKAFRIPHTEIFGILEKRAAGEFVYGPIIIYSLVDNTIKLHDEPISSFDKSEMEFFQQVAQGKEKAAVEGAEVFNYLKEAVLKKAPK